MRMDLELRLYTKDVTWLCFRHAMERASKGEEILSEVDDFGNGYSWLIQICTDCEPSFKPVIR